MEIFSIKSILYGDIHVADKSSHLPENVFKYHSENWLYSLTTFPGLPYLKQCDVFKIFRGIIHY